MNVRSGLSQIRKNAYLLRILFQKYGVRGVPRVVWDDVLFDVRKGTDTFMPVHQDDLFEPDEAQVMRKYAGSPFGVVRSSIELVEDDIDMSSVNFVDVGSGKGKVLIAAAEYPFADVKGVEYSELLHDIAGANMEKLGLTDRVTLVNVDAGSWIPEPEDRVLFFFNPFTGDLLRNVLTNITTTAPPGSKTILLYANPVADEVVAEYMTKTEEYSIDPGGIRVYRYEHEAAPIDG